MSVLEDLEYIETIEPTCENAVAMLELTLQDVRAGGFKNPLGLANPSDEGMISTQQQKLSMYPERYCGYTRNGKLVAYMKQNAWLAGDELPFASLLYKLIRKTRRVYRANPYTGMWGVFGLVASDELNEEQRNFVLTDLLRRSFVDTRSGEERTVNVVIHDHDPLLKIAKRLAFIPVGMKSEAAGAPGLKQRRYQRKASS